MNKLCITLCIIFLSGCHTRTEKTFSKLKSYIDNIKVVDTHEHHTYTAENAGDYAFFNDMFYFKADMISAGLPLRQDLKGSVEELRDLFDYQHRSGSFCGASALRKSLR